MSNTIGFFGSGQVGGGVAQLLIKAGYSVVLSNSRGPDTLAPVINALGSNARADTPENIANNDSIDIIVLAIPLKNIPELLNPLEFNDKIIIDTSNYVPSRDGELLELDKRETITSEYVKQFIDESNKFVKAFNNIDSIHLRLSGTQEKSLQTTIPIAGDDNDAKSKVTKMINDMGFKTYDVGDSKQSWKFEPNTPFFTDPYIPRTDLDEDTHYDELKKFFATTPSPPLSKEEIENFIEQAIQEGPVGGKVSNGPKVWSEILVDMKTRCLEAKANNSSVLVPLETEKEPYY